MSAAAPAGAAAVARSRPACELAEIVRRYGDEYRRTHRLGWTQLKALRDIERCRTPELGGFREYCDDCGFLRDVYHSCRNRHCPKCQTQERAAWAEARQAELLPVPYFHHVFTLPHELHPLVYASPRNHRALLKLLFDATAATLLEFGRRNLGGRVGFTLVLHTWDQQLRPHLHLHCLMASGAIAEDGAHWIAGGRTFLFPVHGLSRVFRGKFLHGLAALIDAGALDVPPPLAALGTGACDRRWLSRWLPKEWVEYSKPPFAGPQKLVEYLSRYTHRVAISNDRLISCDDGQVRFYYRDRRDGDRVKIAEVPVAKFLGRFLMHVLPDRFQRIRHYGFLANRSKQKSLARCRELLGMRPSAEPEPRPRTLEQWCRDTLGIEPGRCPCCGHTLQRVNLPPHGALQGPLALQPPVIQPEPPDTS